MITLAQYWMGRDGAYAAECTLAVRRNAVETVRRVNLALELAAADGVEPGVDQVTHNAVASGWRPRGINARTANAGDASTHITAEGCDVQDHPDRPLARWALRNLEKLEEIGLWMEDPQWTGGADPWVHWQIRPPHSGKRVYIPSTQPPLAAKLPEQIVA